MKTEEPLMLTITGIPHRGDRKIVRDFVQFSIDQFVSRHRQKKAHIIVRAIDRKTLPEDEQEEFEEAGAWMEYCFGRDKQGRRKMVVTITKESIRDYPGADGNGRLKKFLQMLAHEIVHVKQYLNHELFDYRDGKRVRYKGKLYANPTSKTMDWEYFNSPWEIEAYGRVEGIYDMYWKHREG